MPVVELLAIAVEFLGFFCAMFALVAWTSLVVDAFRFGQPRDAWFALLCVGYALYWGARHMTHPKRNVLVVGTLVGAVASAIFLVTGTLVRAMLGAR